MPLTLVTGPANAAKAGHVLGSVRAAAALRPLLVVPTLEDVQRYERELAASGPVFGGRVVRFDGLLGEVAARTGHVAVRVGEPARRRLLRAALSELRLEVLAASAQAPGFVDAALDLAAELDRALIDPPRFAAALRAWAAGDAERRAYAEEVAAVVLAYRRALDRAGVEDDPLFGRRALDALRRAPGRWGSTAVLLYGFDDLTPLQRDAVETLAGPCGSAVTVGLAFEAGHPAFHGRATAVEELRPLADEHVELPDRSGHYAEHARAVLHHVERRLFADEPPAADPRGSHDPYDAGPQGALDLAGTPPAPDPAGAVELLEAGGERAELELVAGRILRLLDDGVPAESIAVVFRSPARRAALVREVFGAYGVPHRVTTPTPLAHTALGRGVLGLARCALAADATADDLLDWLRVPGHLERPQFADDLERRLRRGGVTDARGARAAWEGRHWRLDPVDHIAEAARRGPVELMGALGDAAMRLLERPRRRQAELLDPEEVVDARVVSVLRGALDELAALAACDGRSAPSPAELLEELSSLAVPPAAWGVTGGAVEVADPLSIRARRFHAVFVCGLVEGEWPAPGAGPDPFLDDERRREVNVASGMRLAAREQGLEDERYAFYACVSRPQALLVLSHRSSDEEGNPAVASPFLADVRELFAGRLDDVRTRRRLADVTWPADRAPTRRERARSAAAEGPRAAPARLGPLRAEASLQRLADQDAFSAGAVETWAACPVRWFVERHLRPEALDPDAEPLRRGSVAHEALARTTARLGREHGTARIGEATLATARRVLDEELHRVVAARPLHHHPTRNAGLVRRLRADLQRFLGREAACPSGWEPRWVELSFGGAGDPGWEPSVRANDPAPELGPLVLGDGEVALRGVIDRIDVDPAGRAAAVRDYKLSRAHPLASWRDGQVQAAVYLLAVERLLGLRPVAGLYQPLTGELRPRGVVRGDPAEHGLERAGCYDNDVVDDAGFDECLRWAEAFVLEQVRAMRSGALEARPGTCSPRGRCAYPGICRSRLA